MNGAQGVRLDKDLHQMHPHKASGLDGMNPFFYQKYREVVGQDVSNAATGYFARSVYFPQFKSHVCAAHP